MAEAVILFFRGQVYAVGSDVDLARLPIPLSQREIRRAAYVEPASCVLRSIFHGLRRVFGDHGRVARFTRNWPCLWQVDARPIGRAVFGPFPTRAVALAWEREQVLDYLRSAIKQQASPIVFTKEG